MFNKKVVFLGFGNWGSACAKLFADSGYKVLAWSIEQDVVDEMNSTHVNSKYFPNAKAFSKNIKLTTNFDEALKFSNLIVWALPFGFFDKYSDDLKKHIANSKSKVTLVNLAKSFIFNKNTFLISDHLESVLGKNKFNIVSILGAGFAKEVIAEKATVLSVASNKPEIAKVLSKEIKGDFFTLEYAEDLKLLEFGCSIKNIYAIGAGVINGVDNSINTTSSYIALALKEAENIYEILFKKKNTNIFKTAIIADFFLTCSSDLSRNFTFGKAFAEGNKIDDAVTVEGLNALINLTKIIGLKNLIKFPIMKKINDTIITKKIKPNNFVKNLTR